MFGLSMWEIIIIVLVALFVIGPKRLPDVAKSLGKGYGEFKRTFNEMKQTINIDDNAINTPKKTNQNEDKIEKYSAQYVSQWEDKFTNNIEPSDTSNKEDKKG